MNFLAHLHLSHDTPEHRVGNVLADFVRNPVVKTLPDAIQAGVRQHRAVDAFTDRHPLVQRSIVRISQTWGWFSGIIVDVYYDHLLARDWDRYCEEPLRSFADRMYAVMAACVPHVEAAARPFFERFVADDRLVRYRTPDGIADTLARVSRRIAERMPTRAVALQDAMPDLVANHAGLRDDFHTFYPELMAFAKTA